MLPHKDKNQAERPSKKRRESREGKKGENVSIVTSIDIVILNPGSYLDPGPNFQNLAI